MARFDKYDPVSGGFRAKLAAAYTGSDDPVGVGIDANGRVVLGAGATGVVGIMIQPEDRAAGDVVDVMTAGEILENTTGDAGDIIHVVDASGALGTGAPGAGQTRVGFTVEDDRIIVRV